MSSGRLEDLIRFYSILNTLESRLGGVRKLSAFTGRMDWPKRGVYFFQELGECRLDRGIGLRLSRTPVSDPSDFNWISLHRGKR
jgi:hypothetical protein